MVDKALVTSDFKLVIDLDPISWTYDFSPPPKIKISWESFREDGVVDKTFLYSLILSLTYTGLHRRFIEIPILAAKLHPWSEAFSDPGRPH